MNKQWLDSMWPHMRSKYGIYLRALDAIPEDQFHAHPIPGMRTPAELVVHTSGSIVRDIAEGVASGSIEADEAGEAEIAATLTSKAEVMDYARECWKRAEAAIAQVDDEKLAGEVQNRWGIPGLNGVFSMVIINDEFMHHRGQLFAYVRAAGGEPPFMWGFEENPDGFRPEA
jgi:uncharacterized damage-inducible protein DinB